MKNIILVCALIGISLAACNNVGSSKSEQTAVSEVSATDKDNFMNVIMKRKSVRKFVKERPVSEEDITSLMWAAMAAPSGKNLQPWEFVVIDDRETLDRMADELKTAKMLAEAPLAIVVCGDTVNSFYWYLDCAASAQNILLAAEGLGLGAVWTAAYPYRDRMDVVIRNTNLPPHILPLAVIPVGHPKGENLPKNKYNPQKIHVNKW